jgi:hypothetical protein
MDKLPPIPTPAAQRWREFRIQVLPMVMFAGVALGVALLWKSFVAPTGIVGETNSIKADTLNIQDPTVAQSNRVEVALPDLVSVPPGMKLVPGEFVDLSIEPAKP